MWFWHFRFKIEFFFIDMGYCFVNCQFICLFYVKMYLFVFKLTRSSWNIEKYEFKNHIKPDLINQEWYQNLIELVRNTVYVHNSIDKLKYLQIYTKHQHTCIIAIRTSAVFRKHITVVYLSLYEHKTIT